MDSVWEKTSKFLEKASSTFDDFRETIEDNPVYVGLLGMAVFVLYLGIYFLYTRQPRAGGGMASCGTRPRTLTLSTM